ncbi:mortality factor 4-like protein 1 [Oryctolagus cuniculus]|uniref:mortality factor 4-like protein 1 n=1 Tax=Oryctolagus cuniculus TaxID=9986 RepID=UPI00387A4A65
MEKMNMHKSGPQQPRASGPALESGGQQSEEPKGRIVFSRLQVINGEKRFILDLSTSRVSKHQPPKKLLKEVIENTLFDTSAKKNVDSILEDYANYKKSRGNTDNKEYAVNEVVAGIKEYFNVMLGTQLLYKFERPQYAEILADHPDAPMSQVYGAPHLLRLFVRIGAMLAYTPLDEKSLALLLNYLHDFLKYLAKNSATLFSASDYEVAPPEYHRKAV